MLVEKLIPQKWEEPFYRQRALWGNIFALLGLIIVLIDAQIHLTPFRLLIGFAVALIGCGLRIWASGYIWTNIDQPLPAAQLGLITAGPYAYVRNPIYLGAILMISGLYISFGSWIAALVAIVPTIFMHSWHIKYEEEFMVEQFGNTFLEYKSKIPALVPNIWGRYQSNHGEFHFARGLKHDIGPISSFAILFVAMFCYSVLVNTSPGALALLLLVLVAVFGSFIVVFLTHRFFIAG